MAGATVYLARYTHTLAKDTADGIKQADRHHRENLRPFCVIDFDYSTAQDPFGLDWSGNPRLTEASFLATAEPPPPGNISIRGMLHNKGKGPAKDVVVYFNMGSGEEHALRLTCPVVVSGLVGAEEDATIEVSITERDIIPFWDGSKWQPAQTMHGVLSDTYEVVLEYRDIFDSFFRTVHRRGIPYDPAADVAAITDPKARAELLMRWNCPTPIFYIGQQAQRTIADVLRGAPHCPRGD
jgi:hypothetical protein